MSATLRAENVWQSNGNDFLHFISPNGGAVLAYIDANGVFNAAANPLVAAAQSTFFAMSSNPVLSASSTAITGAVAAVRGNTTIASGTTVTSGFIYGTEGKVTIKGTASSANFTAGLVGQLDLSAATALGTGQIAAIWGDMGATMSAGAISGEAVLDIMLLTNTCAGSSVNSVIHAEALATYFLDVSNATYPSGWTNTASVGAQTGRIKIKTPSGDAYIAVYAAS